MPPKMDPPPVLDLVRYKNDHLYDSGSNCSLVPILYDIKHGTQLTQECAVANRDLAKLW